MSRALPDQHPVRSLFSTTPGGLGIDFSRYRKIVTAPGGRFTVDSQHGEGITVTVSFQTHPEHAPC